MCSVGAYWRRLDGMDTQSQPGFVSAGACFFLSFLTTLLPLISAVVKLRKSGGWGAAFSSVLLLCCGGDVGRASLIGSC